jgi:hypothetical protein
MNAPSSRFGTIGGIMTGLSTFLANHALIVLSKISDQVLPRQYRTRSMIGILQLLLLFINLQGSIISILRNTRVIKGDSQMGSTYQAECK